MSATPPDSSFSKQDNTSERAERSEPVPVYLSEDSDAEQEEAAFTSGAPGFSSLSSFISSAYQNPNFQSRNEEIESMKTVVNPEEDRKLSPPSSSSKHESESDFESETELEKTEKPKRKIVKLTS